MPHKKLNILKREFIFMKKIFRSLLALLVFPIIAFAQTTPTCKPTYSTGCGSGDYISRVAIGSINNASACSPSPFYTYYSAIAPTVISQGAVGALSVTINASGTEHVSAWIDYNDNGVFTDPGEQVMTDLSSSTTGTVLTSNFVVSCSAPLGTKVLRVVLNFNAAPTSCGAFTYGETEDYKVSIIAGNTNANTWTGATSTDWNTAGNWSLGTIPSACQDVIIPGAPANQPILSAAPNAICNNITIDPSASLVLNGARFTPQANVTVNGFLANNAGFDMKAATTFVVGPSATYTHNPTTSNAANATMFTNAAEEFYRPTDGSNYSTLEILNWYAYANTPLAAAMTDALDPNYGNVILNTANPTVEWSQGGLFAGNEIKGQLEVGTSWITLDKSNTNAKVFNIGKILMRTGAGRLFAHNANGTGSVTINTGGLVINGGVFLGITNSSGGNIIEATNFTLNVDSLIITSGASFFGASEISATNYDISGAVLTNAKRVVNNGTFIGVNGGTTITGGASVGIVTSKFDLVVNEDIINGSIFSGSSAFSGPFATGAVNIKANNIFNTGTFIGTDFSNGKATIQTIKNLVTSGTEFNGTVGGDAVDIIVGDSLQVLSGLFQGIFSFSDESSNGDLNLTTKHLIVTSTFYGINSGNGNSNIKVNQNLIFNSGFLIGLDGGIGNSRIAVSGSYTQAGGSAFVLRGYSDTRAKGNMSFLSGDFLVKAPGSFIGDNNSAGLLDTVAVKNGTIDGGIVMLQKGTLSTPVSASLYFKSDDISIVNNGSFSVGDLASVGAFSIINKNIDIASGKLLLKSDVGVVNMNCENLVIGAGDFICHSNIVNTAVPTSDKISITANGSFIQNGGTFDFDTAPSGQNHSLTLRGSAVALNAGVLTRSGTGTAGSSNSFGNINFSRNGVVNYFRAPAHTLQQAIQTVTASCTVSATTNMQIASHQAPLYSLVINKDATLALGAGTISGNSAGDYFSGVQVDKGGRFKLQNPLGFYDGTQNAAVAAKVRPSSANFQMNYSLADSSIVEYNGMAAGGQILTGKYPNNLTAVGDVNASTLSQYQYGILDINYTGGFADAAKMTASNVFVRNNLKLTEGKLSLNKFTATVLNGASSAISRTNGLVESESSDNNSRLKWAIGTNTGIHTFPFGTSAGTYIPLIINLKADSLGSVSAATYPSAADNKPYPLLPVPVTNINNPSGVDGSALVADRFWQIDRSSTAGTADITFTASPAETAGLNNLMSKSWNLATTTWTLPAGTQANTPLSATVTNNTVYNTPWSLWGECGTLTTPTAANVNQCGSGTSTITATGAGAGEDYNWYSTSTGGSPLQSGGSTYTTGTIASNTTYYVSKFATSSKCESARVPVAVLVGSNNNVAVANGPSSVCYNSTAMLDISNASGATSIQWQESNTGAVGSFSDVTGGSGANTVSYTTVPLQKDSYFSALVDGCRTNVLMVVVNAAPIISPSITPTICPGDNVIVTTSADNYTWSNASTVSKNSATQYKLSPGSSTTYLVTVSSGTCVATTTYAVDVQSAPSFTINDLTVCTEGTGTLTLDNISNANSFDWAFSSPQFPNKQNDASGKYEIIGLGKTKGTYFVTVTAYNGGSCTFKQVAKVIITDAITKGTVQAPNPASAICPGTTVTLAINGTVGNIVWMAHQQGKADQSIPVTSFKSDNSVVSTDYDPQANAATTVSYYAQISAGGCAPVNSDYIEVTYLSPASLVVLTPLNTALSNNCSSNFTFSGTDLDVSMPGANESGEWTAVSPSTVIVNQMSYNNVSLSDLQPGNNVLRYTITNNISGCQHSALLTVKYNEPVNPAEVNAGADQVICQNNSYFNAQSLSQPGVVGTWTVIAPYASTNNPPLLPSIINKNDPKSIVTNLSVGVNHFAWTVSNGTCDPVVDYVDISYLPGAVAGTISPAPSSVICFNNQFSLSVAGNSGGSNVQWEEMLPGEDWKEIPGANSTVYTTLAQSSRTYRMKIANAHSSCKQQYTNEVFVKVVPKPEKPVISGTAAQCLGAVTSLSIDYTMDVKWETTDDISGTPLITNYTSSVSPSITVTVSKAVQYFRAVVGEAPCDKIASDWFKVSGAVASQAGQLSASSSYICRGSDVLLSLKNSKGDSYRWLFSSNDSTYIELQNTGLSASYLVMPSQSGYYRALVQNQVCDPTRSDSVYIKVDQPVITGTAAITSPTICFGGSTTLKLFGSQGSIQWQESFDGFNNWKNLSTTAIGTATASYYRVIPNGKSYYRAVVSNGLCGSVASKVISVKTTAQLIKSGTAYTDGPACGDQPVSIRLANYSGNIGWEFSDDNKTFSQYLPNANGSPSIVVQPQNLTYYRAVVENGASCADTSNLIIVDPRPFAVGTISGKNSICKGEQTILNLNNSQGNIQWMESADGQSFSDIAGATSSSLSYSPATSSIVRAKIETGACSGFTANYQVSVNTSVQSGYILAASPTVCAGSSTTLKLYSNIGNEIEWQQSANGQNFSTIAGSTSSSSFEVSPQGALNYYRAKITSGVCGTAVTAYIKVYTSAAAVAGVAGISNSKVCKGDSVYLNISAHSGNIQWQSSAYANMGYSDIGGATASTYGMLAASKLYYRAKISRDACKEVYSNVVSVDVYPALSSGTISALADTLCKGNFTSLSVSNTIGEIQWEYSYDLINWENQAYGNGAVITTLPLSKSIYYRVKVINEICSKYSDPYLIYVEQANLSGNISGDQKLCEGQQGSIKLNQYFGNIQWQGAVDGINYANIANETGPELKFTAQQSISYRVELSKTGCNTAYSSAIKVTVNAKPQAGTITPKRQSIDPATGTAYFNIRNIESSNIQWQKSTDSLSFADIAGANSAIFSDNPKVKSYYRIKASNAQCESYSSVAVVELSTINFEVYPVPVQEVLNSRFSAEEAGDYTAEIYDMLGHKLYSSAIKVQVGVNEIKINVGQLSGGYYHLKIYNSRRIKQANFMKM